MHKKIFVLTIIGITFFTFLFIFYKKEEYKISDSLYKINSYTENEIKTGYGLLYNIKDKGYIITNYHIIKDSYDIILENSDNKIEARVLNYDEYSDIAVLSIDKKYANKVIKKSNKYKQLYTIDRANIKNSKKIKCLENSRVIINLEKENFIVDAKKIKGDITFGNSGGPIYNENNEILGIIFTKDENYGYALDIDKSLKIAKQLEEGKINYPKFPVDIEDENSIVVKNDNEYFKTGDTILSIDGNKVRNIMELNYYLYKYNVGDTVKINIKRKDSTYSRKITLN